MQFNVLCYLAIMIFSGMAFGRLVKLVKLPNVTGYLLAGLVLGPSVLKIIPKDTIDSIAVISEVALGFIAFSIGNEFKMSYFKKVGAAPIVIAALEALGAVVAVCAVLVAFGNDLPFSIVLSSIAAATAPAATIMVIRQYKAKGPVTETLLSVVALDDAVALMLFGIAVAVAGMLNSTANVSVVSMIFSPIVEIIGALGIGAVLGMLLTYFVRFFKKDGNRLLACGRLCICRYRNCRCARHFVAPSLYGAGRGVCQFFQTVSPCYESCRCGDTADIYAVFRRIGRGARAFGSADSRRCGCYIRCVPRCRQGFGCVCRRGGMQVRQKNQKISRLCAFAPGRRCNRSVACRNDGCARIRSDNPRDCTLCNVYIRTSRACRYENCT